MPFQQLLVEGSVPPVLELPFPLQPKPQVAVLFRLGFDDQGGKGDLAAQRSKEAFNSLIMNGNQARAGGGVENPCWTNGLYCLIQSGIASGAMGRAMA